MLICKVAKGMQKLLEPLQGGCNECNIISIKQDKGCQQFRVRGMRLERGLGMCSNEISDPVKEYMGAGGEALLHPFVDIKGSR